MKWIAFVALVVALTSCSDQNPASAPPQPRSIHGRVHLVGAERDGTGADQGPRVEESVDGAIVRLLRDGAEIATAVTSEGEFTFDVFEDGTYRAATWIDASRPVVTDEIEVAGHDVEIPEPLALSRHGDVSVYPNPFVATDTAVHFFLPIARHATVRILEPGLAVVTTLLDEHREWGHHRIRWNGFGDDGLPAPAGTYWACVETAGAISTDVVFVDQAIEIPEEPLVTWTISGSPSDPYANEVSTPTEGLSCLYIPQRGERHGPPSRHGLRFGRGRGRRAAGLRRGRNGREDVPRPFDAERAEPQSVVCRSRAVPELQRGIRERRHRRVPRPFRPGGPLPVASPASRGRSISALDAARASR